MKRIMKRTEKYNKKLFNILIAYGGRFELTNAFKKLVEGAMKSGRIVITQKKIEENLLVSGDVDLLIRTGGTHRLSNFLPWQSTYAEIYVTETLWPDFSKRELMKAIRWFSESQRNFGK
jgi:undecaprenyl diphosphate synthase